MPRSTSTSHLTRRSILFGLGLLGVFTTSTAALGFPVAKDFPPPPKTAWVPQGCRRVPATVPVSPSSLQWSNLHGDGLSSDSVSGILAPVLQEAWTAEEATYNVTGPVFDRSGNLYFAPLSPHENVVLISIEPETGARRWAIPGTGAPPGGGTPMVLLDPDSSGDEIVYLALYDRVLAVRTDGTIVWDVATGLTLGPDPFANYVLGTNYLPSLDAILGLSADGHLFAVDRRTGTTVLSAPFELPGEPTPPGTPLALPPTIVAAAEAEYAAFVDGPPGGFQKLIHLLLGNGTEVANMFSVDPWTSRIWVAGTAPDAEDGLVDGTSQLGALFRLEVVPNGPAYGVVEVCHRSFAGGSASTPTLGADGSRIYLGDNFGKLLAIESDCSQAWELDLGSQVFGSVSVGADKSEIFASTAQFIKKVVDTGPAGSEVWTANLDVFDGLTGTQVNLNMNLVNAASNGLAFQAGGGPLNGATPLPLTLGVGQLDRETGEVRYFTAGGEETVAVMSSGPDGALYVGNSPVRRIITKVLGLAPQPLRGGVTKFGRERLDLFVRDAGCAGEARARNAALYFQSCPVASSEADRRQILDVVTQAQGAIAPGLAAGDLSAKDATWLTTQLTKTSEALHLADGDQTKLVSSLRRSRNRLRAVCRRRGLND